MPPPSTRSDPPLSAPATRATPRARAGKATPPPPPPIPLTRSPVAIRCYQIIIKKTPSARSKMEELRNLSLQVHGLDAKNIVSVAAAARVHAF